DSLRFGVLDTICSSPPATACPDIIIDSAVTWTDTTILMCKNQYIRITKKGSLHLINTQITINDNPQPPSVACPDLIPEYLWGGIIIEGKSVIYDAPSEPIIRGTLELSQNSILEFASTAVSAPTRFGRITIDSSTIRYCGQLIDVRDVWPFSYP